LKSRGWEDVGMKFLHMRDKAPSGWRWKPEDLAERPEDVSNPGRGWYRIYTFQIEQEPDFGELEWCLDRKDTLALVFMDIGGYRDRDLDTEALERMRRVLAFFGKNGYDIILRVAYDHQGKAVEREPYFWDQVKAHMRQVGELLRDYGEHIFIYQGLLTGNWGEMHTTRFQDGKKRKELWTILREYCPAGVYASVRRPVYWRQLHEEQQGRKTDTADMGLFDDAMFASEDHLGTFGVLSRENGWGEAWNREEELRFEEELCRNVPNGGEAVLGEEFQGQLTPEKVVDTLRRMHITYLNKAYDPGILELWKQWRYPGTAVWNDKSFYDYVGAHLGYRLVIRDVQFKVRRGGEGGNLEITVENTGFASLYQSIEFWLDCQAEEDEPLSVKLEGKGRETVWNSGEIRTLYGDVPLECRQILLRANRRSDGAVIRFANGCDDKGRTRIGKLER